MNHMQRSRLAPLQGLPSSGSAFRGALAPQQRACSSPHVGRQIRSPGVSAGTAALSQLHRHRHLDPRHRYTALKAQPERSTEYSDSDLELDVEIRQTKGDIKAAEEEVNGAKLAVQETRDALGNVEAKLASTSSPVLSKKEEDALLTKRQVLLTELQYKCMDLQQLRTNLQQLRTNLQQLREEKLKLRTKEQQLREELRTKEQQLREELRTKEQQLREELRTKEQQLREELRTKEQQLREEKLKLTGELAGLRRVSLGGSHRDRDSNHQKQTLLTGFL